MKKLLTLFILYTLSLTLWAAIPDSLLLNQVVVTGTRTQKLLKNTPIQTRLISAKDIERVDATNIQDLLTQELPGVEFSYAMNQQTHLNFSGFGGQSVLFLVDGERLAGETMDDVDFTRLNMSNVERIEIIKGAASALYGSNANGGVINVITKAPTKPWTLNVNGRIANHHNNRYGLNFGLNSKHLQNLLTFTATHIDSYDVTNGDISKAQTQYMVQTYYGDKTYNINDKLTWRMLDNLRFTFKAGYFFRNKATTTINEPDHYRDLNFGARGLWDISKRDNIEMSYNFDQYDKAKHYLNTDRCIRNYSNVQNSVRALYNHTFSSSSRDFDYSVSGNMLPDSPPKKKDNDILTIGGDFMRDYLLNSKTLDGRYSQITADVFAQYDWNISDKLEVVGALRYDYFSDGNVSRLSPKINMRYKAMKNLTLRMGYGMGFRAPTLKEKYYIFNMAGIWDVVGSNIVGNDLKPETSHNVNLSAEYTYNGFVFTMAPFYNHINNRITTGSPATKDTFPGDASLLSTNRWLPYVNVKSYDCYGLDFTVQKQWTNGLGAKIAYTYIHEQLPKDENGEAINNQYQPARPHSLNASVNWDKQLVPDYGVNICLSGRFLSAVDNIEYIDYLTIDPSTGQLARTNVHYDAYTIWKLQITQRFYKAVKCTFTLDNLLNYNPEYHYFNAPFTDGIAILAGLSIDIDKFF